MTAKVVSNGVSKNTKVYDTEGKLISGVSRIEWIIDAREGHPKVSELRLTFFGAEAEIEGQVQGFPTPALTRIL